MGDELFEYNARGETLLYDAHGSPRDIDVINAPGANDNEPFAVDTRAFDSPELSIRQEGDNWWLRSAEKGFAEPLHPAVMQPVEGLTVHGIPAVTIPWQTHSALTIARGVPRRKDDVTMRLLEEVGKKQTQRLPDGMYEPFRLLAAMPERRRVPKYIFRRFVPRRVKELVTPSLQTIGLISTGNDR